MKRKYGVLGFIAALYQVIGSLALLAGIILIVVALIALATNTQSVGQELLLPSGLASLVSGLLLVGFGQLLNLLRDMELNSRRSAAYLQYLVKQSRARTRRSNTNVRTPAPRTPPAPIPREDARG